MVGKRVLLTGLGARPELNGQSGIAESFNPDTGRYVIELASGEIVAIKPQSVLAQGGGDGETGREGGGADGDRGRAGAAAAAGGFPQFPPQYIAAAMALVLALGAGANFMSAAALIAVGLIGSVAYADPTIVAGRLGAGVGNPVERVCAALHRATGVIVTPNHLAAGAAGVVGLGWYFYFGPGSDSYGRYEHQPRSGYGGGGYSFYYLMSVMMLASYIRRMGSTPNGWDLGQFWHSLQNIDFWQGMMLMNMVQRVLNGGGGRRRF